MGAISAAYDDVDVANFKLGIYQHYKGGLYTALLIVQHHDTRRPMVVYVSHEKGSINCRPLRGWHGSPTGGHIVEDPECHDPDGWLDEVELTEPGVGKTGERGPRFRYIGPARS
jgi:hypothetical protein